MKKNIKKISFILAAIAVLIVGYFTFNKTAGTVEILNHVSADIPSTPSDGDSSGSGGSCGVGVGDGACGPGL